MSAQDFRESGMNPQEWRENRQRELEEQLNREQQERQQQQNNNQETETNKPHRLRNLARAHNINAHSIGRGLYRGGKRAIGGVARFGTRTAFRAAGGTLAGAVALATGRGVGGALASAYAGANVGGRLANGVNNVAGTAWRGVEATGRGARRVGRAIHAGATGGSVSDQLLGGTRLGRELDTANGNTRYQTAGNAREIKNDENNRQYVREYMAAQNGGVMPTDKEVRAKMNSFDPYLAEGLTDIKDMLKAQKAESIGISSKQAAIIAAIGKERGITADILNDDKKATAQRANLQQDFINKGYTQQAASQRADYTMNVLKVQNGVANSLQGATQTTPRQERNTNQSRGSRGTRRNNNN